jgi:hypothetical protein
MLPSQTDQVGKNIIKFQYHKTKQRLCTLLCIMVAMAELSSAKSFHLILVAGLDWFWSLWMSMTDLDSILPGVWNTGRLDKDLERVTWVFKSRHVNFENGLRNSYHQKKKKSELDSAFQIFEPSFLILIYWSKTNLNLESIIFRIVDSTSLTLGSV